MTSAAMRTTVVRSDRNQLLFIAAGLGTGSAVWFVLFRGSAASWVLLGLATVALAGFVAYPWIGRGIVLIFTLAARVVGWVLSSVALLLMYVVVVIGIGTLIRLFGVNRLDRDFTACRTRATMLVEVPPMTAAGFRRQS